METIIVLTAIFAFISTNFDDLFLLAAYFTHPTFKIREVVLGQYLGFIILLIVSSLAYFAQLVIPYAWISLLGILPIIIGIRGLMSLKNRENDFQDINDEITEKKDGITHNNILSVVSVTIANGGDNLGVYMPLFATINSFSLIVMVLTFLILIGIWCLLGFKLVNNRILGNKIRKYGHLILPFVMIFIGIGIILKGWI